MKRVGIVYERPLDTGGVETHLLSLFRHVNRLQYGFTVFSPVSAAFQEKANSLEVNVCQIPRYTPLSLSTVSGLVGLFRREKIDLVHIHSPVAAIPGRQAARLCGLPGIVTVHSPVARYYGVLRTPRARLGRWLYTNLDRLLNYTFTDRLIYVSGRAYQEALAGRFAPARRSVIIPNGIDLTKFQQPCASAHLREQHATPEDALVLAYLGRLDEQKGVDVLLQALALLRPEPETKILAWIIGSGPEREKLQSLGQALGIGEMVRFIGHQENVAGLLQASDLFVLPSHSEGMSIALLEALAAGLPCVVTDVGDNALVVADGIQGRVVPPGQPQAIAQAIQALVRDGGLRQRMGEQAREKALEYSDVSMAQQVEALYGQLA